MRAHPNPLPLQPRASAGYSKCFERRSHRRHKPSLPLGQHRTRHPQTPSPASDSGRARNIQSTAPTLLNTLPSLSISPHGAATAHGILTQTAMPASRANFTPDDEEPPSSSPCPRCRRTSPTSARAPLTHPSPARRTTGAHRHVASRARKNGQQRPQRLRARVAGDFYFIGIRKLRAHPALPSKKPRALAAAAPTTGQSQGYEVAAHPRGVRSQRTGGARTQSSSPRVRTICNCMQHSYPLERRPPNSPAVRTLRRARYRPRARGRTATPMLSRGGEMNDAAEEGAPQSVVNHGFW